MFISSAWAHGSGSGAAVGGFGPLIFIPAIIAFVLFIVFVGTKKGWSVLVTGGAGYVGSALVLKLLERGHRVTVLDLYLYGEGSLDRVRAYQDLREIKGDVRDPDTVAEALRGCNAVIHLAGISDEASYDLDPDRGRSINLGAFQPLVRAAKKAGIKRFITASSYCVYGATHEPWLTEDLPLAPLTNFAEDKALCEKVLEEERAPGFITCTVRPAYICGPSPRQRLDLAANLLTSQAVNQGRIQIAGESRKCPSIHIDDMVELYVFLLRQPDSRIDGKIYNAGSENPTLLELAEMVRNAVGGDCPIDVKSADAPSSHHLSSDRIREELGFQPKRTIEAAVRDLAAAFQNGKIQGPSSEDSK